MPIQPNPLKTRLASGGDAYGTMLFAPFSDMRVAWDAVGIIDPFYSIPLLLALIAAGFLGLGRKASAVVMQATLLVTTAYLFYGWTLAFQFNG